MTQTRNPQIHSWAVATDTILDVELIASATPPHDEIIQALLANRPRMTDVSEEFEVERQRRMYNMLRYSSHYKRLQVQQANNTWQDDIQGLLNEDEMSQALQGTCDNPDVTDIIPTNTPQHHTLADSDTTPTLHKKVSFDKKLTFIADCNEERLTYTTLRDQIDKSFVASLGLGWAKLNL